MAAYCYCRDTSLYGMDTEVRYRESRNKKPEGMKDGTDSGVPATWHFVYTVRVC